MDASSEVLEDSEKQATLETTISVTLVDDVELAKAVLIRKVHFFLQETYRKTCQMNGALLEVGNLPIRKRRSSSRDDSRIAESLIRSASIPQAHPKTNQKCTPKQESGLQGFLLCLPYFAPTRSPSGRRGVPTRLRSERSEDEPGQTHRPAKRNAAASRTRARKRVIVPFWKAVGPRLSLGRLLGICFQHCDVFK